MNQVHRPVLLTPPPFLTLDYRHVALLNSLLAVSIPCTTTLISAVTNFAIPYNNPYTRFSHASKDSTVFDVHSS